MGHSHLKHHPLTGTTDHILTGLQNNELLRINSAGTSIESTGIDATDLFLNTGGTISGSVNIANDLVILGDFTVFGTATTIHTTDLSVEDSHIVLNYSGNHITAIGGGVRLISGQTSGSESSILTDNVGNWMATPGFYSPNLTGGTIFSGSTNLETIITNLVDTNVTPTHVQPGQNITTGGTNQNPIVN